MQSREGQFDSSVTRPLTCHLQPLSHRRGMLLVTSHSSTVIQTDSALPS
nr:unnamed protein product [Callosobruchus chinensis]